MGQGADLRLRDVRNHPPRCGSRLRHYNRGVAGQVECLATASREGGARLAEASTVSTDQLKEIARRVRKHILEMTAQVNSGHPGGSLSAVEIVTALYFGVMRHDPARVDWPERDRFIMSKGHATPVIYSVLAEADYFP